MKLSDIFPQSELDDFLRTSPDVVAAKLELANEVVEYARSISPEDTGKYKDGIKARRYGSTGVGVVWTDPISNLIEYGSIHNAEYAVRARTIEHFKGTDQ